MTERDYGEKFLNITSCSDADQKVLESLRFRDQDACLKGGAVLAFSALILACILVVLAAPPDAQVFVGRGTATYWGLLVAFWLSLAGALLSFASVVHREQEFSSDPFEANWHYYRIIQRKNAAANLSMALTGCAAILMVGGSSLALL